MNIYLASERVRHPCFGVVGGRPGSAGKVHKNGEPQFPKGKVVLKTGDRLEVETPGGGGWGKTSERSAAAIELDLAEGLITPQAARQIYGHQRSSLAATAAE
ncbi:N-methylhydantoinase B/oxoprolinase/acetone carboxylase alpha subunit [Bradyrhizobium diazoefficiens]